MGVNLVETARPGRLCKDGTIRGRVEVAVAVLVGRVNNYGIAAITLNVRINAAVQTVSFRQFGSQPGRIGEHPAHDFSLTG